MTVLETERLVLSRLSYDDCDFIVELLNEPAFQRYIGDKAVRSRADAREYLHKGPIGSYERHGFGMFLVRSRSDNASMGMCGLVKRKEFDAPDVGFAFLRRFWASGYAAESATAVLEYGKNVLQLPRIIAMVDPENEASIRLVEKLGLTFEGTVRMPGETDEINMYTTVVE
ncbi:MAG: GNAT family N-acetyltransferase [Gammaproteobacteria bacterium]|nr:MAG: GNAT family N-acetyltransferase [Gammaproteobacteria bacterium]RLA35572.1 MAG: GNAT family N-acetyltransferase [Gammaproteobacteria bacterium]